MGKYISVYLNRDEWFKVIQNWKITEDEANKFMKQMILNPDKFMKVFNQQIDENKNTNVVEKIKTDANDMTLDELKKKLGIRGNNAQKAVDAKGLYFKNNVEDYLRKFGREWNGDVYKIPEAMFRLQLLMENELFTQVYVSRMIGQ